MGITNCRDLYSQKEVEMYRVVIDGKKAVMSHFSGTGYHMAVFEKFADNDTLWRPLKSIDIGQRAYNAIREVNFKEFTVKTSGHRITFTGETFTGLRSY